MVQCAAMQEEHKKNVQNNHLNLRIGACGHSVYLRNNFVTKVLFI